MLFLVGARLNADEPGSSPARRIKTIGLIGIADEPFLFNERSKDLSFHQ
jgi:hypothetical protein